MRAAEIAGFNACATVLVGSFHWATRVIELVSVPVFAMTGVSVDQVAPPLASESPVTVRLVSHATKPMAMWSVVTDTEPEFAEVAEPDAAVVPNTRDWFVVTDADVIQQRAALAVVVEPNVMVTVSLPVSALVTLP